jgi:hypothetical protein
MWNRAAGHKRTFATAGAALRAVGRRLVRAVVYLGPLLVAALAYIAKLSIAFLQH